MKGVFFFCVLVLVSLEVVKADIIPNPTRGKGIVPGDSLKVRMVSEQVRVDLYKDHSEVECIFEMRNFDETEDVEVGFPMMEFYPWGMNLGNKDFRGNLHVWVDDEKVDAVEMYVPEDLKEIRREKDKNEEFRLLRQRENANKPWYVWKTKFPKDKTVWIKVTYTLPAYNDKRNHFFSYLLSTGAGWWGTIGKAVVEVTNHDIPKDEIIRISPSRYKKEGNKIVWKFKNLEPTIKDDIEIQYSPLVRKQEIKGLAWFVDGEPRSDGQFIRLNPQEIVTIEVRKDDPKYPSGVIYGFTKTYVFDSFRKSLQSRFPSVYRRLQQEDCKTFGERFEVQVDGRKGDVWKQLSDLKESQLSSVELQKGSEGRELIRIKLKK